MRSPAPPSTSFTREHILSAFMLQVILCLKVPVDINLPCCVLTAFEMICIDVIGISTLYSYILEDNGSIPEIEHSIPYPWK